MRKFGCLCGFITAVSGVVLQPVCADNAWQTQNHYQFPAANAASTQQYQTTPVLPQSGYVYPQGLMQPFALPMYYPYPANTAFYYPPFEPRQPAAVMPYSSPYNPQVAATPGPKAPPVPQSQKVAKPWGDTRHIWPDFYTDFTRDFWDEAMNAPHNMGYMPGGWRFPSLSTPDPVTVGDAVANQMPPILDESANFINFAN